MTDEDKLVIRAECNFLQQLIHDIYIGKEEFTLVNWMSLSKRLQSIRDRLNK